MPTLSYDRRYWSSCARTSLGEPAILAPDNAAVCLDSATPYLQLRANFYRACGFGFSSRSPDVTDLEEKWPLDPKSKARTLHRRRYRLRRSAHGTICANWRTAASTRR